MKKILFTVSQLSNVYEEDFFICNPNENINETILYGIRKIPTLVLDNGPDDIKKIEDLEVIKDYLKI